MSLNLLLKELKRKGNPQKAKVFSQFFKTGPGQYGEGDLFYGISVPESRKISIEYINLSLEEIQKLLHNKYHEARLIGVLILVYKYKQASIDNEKKKIYNFYLKNSKNINNWDLVDVSAHHIVGDYLFHKNTKERKILEKLAVSKNLWERRIAIISTFAFIYKKEYEGTLKIVKILLHDKHDLIQKACGWMLREVGKRVDEKPLIIFLDEYAKIIPRTMLRYSIERLPEKARKHYLKK